MARFACAQSAPPKAPIRFVTDEYFGTKVVDNYRYFENLQDPEVQQWMRAKADYTRATLDALPEQRVLHVFDVEAGEGPAETANRADHPDWRSDNRSFF
jgi:Prolyl oligopeptidase, N-terminal beta-propeller domain